MTAECACYYMQQRCFSVTVSEPVTAGRTWRQPAVKRTTECCRRLQPRRSWKTRCTGGDVIVAGSFSFACWLDKRMRHLRGNKPQSLVMASLCFVFLGRISFGHSLHMGRFAHGSFRVDP